MDRTAQNGHGARAVRVLTLLVVLLGLLAMHGLASTHHAPAAAAEMSATAPLHDPPAAASHHQAAAQPPSPLSAGQATESCNQDCPGAVLALCVAVLAVAAVWAAAVVLRPGRGVITAPTARAVGPLASARVALPPPDPVRELCISRT